MTTDEFIVLCDGISCESKLQVKPIYEEERVRIHDRLADDLHRQIVEVYVSTGTQNFWNELALRKRMEIE